MPRSLFAALHSLLAPRIAAARARSDAGQSTAEYALVMLGAAGLAVALGLWASQTGKIPELLDGVIDKILEHL